jgi:hypothetical protein
VVVVDLLALGFLSRHAVVDYSSDLHFTSARQVNLYKALLFSAERELLHLTLSREKPGYITDPPLTTQLFLQRTHRVW